MPVRIFSVAIAAILFASPIVLDFDGIDRSVLVAVGALMIGLAVAAGRHPRWIQANALLGLFLGMAPFVFSFRYGSSMAVALFFGAVTALVTGMPMAWFVDEKAAVAAAKKPAAKAQRKPRLAIVH